MAAVLRGDRSLIPPALEEVLRMRSPFPQIALEFYPTVFGAKALPLTVW